MTIARFTEERMHALRCELDPGSQLGMIRLDRVPANPMRVVRFVVRSTPWHPDSNVIPTEHNFLDAPRKTMKRDARRVT